jgi:hypothetical protein
MPEEMPSSAVTQTSTTVNIILAGWQSTLYRVVRGEWAGEDAYPTRFFYILAIAKGCSCCLDRNRDFRSPRERVNLSRSRQAGLVLDRPPSSEWTRNAAMSPARGPSLPPKS